MRELTYPSMLLPRLDSEPDRSAVIAGAEQRTLHELVTDAWRVASALREKAGTSPTDRFAVLAGSSVRYACLWQAAAWGGGIVLPVNVRLSDAELVAQLRHASPSVLFADRDHASRCAPLRAHVPSIRTVVVLDDSDAPGDDRFSSFVDGVEATQPLAPTADQPALLMYTGGATGRPKGVLHSQQNLCVGGVERTSSFLRTAIPGLRIYQSPPMFHIMAIVGNLVMPVTGGTTVIPNEFDPGSMLADLANLEITHMAAVPTLIGMLVEHPSYEPNRLRSLRVIAYGGAPMPRALLQRVLQDLPHVGFVSSYGMTEVAGSLTALSPEDHVAGRALTSVGQPVVGVELRIVRDDGELVTDGGPGEIVACCGSELLQYWEDAELTETRLHDGWYRTGDVGRIDEEGYVYVLDRVDDMIISGGENVYTSEVESVIAALPGVAQVAVVGVAHERWGQSVHAVVVERAEGSLTAAAVIEHCSASLARYKVPKTVDIRTEPLPLSGANKVQKHRLRDKGDPVSPPTDSLSISQGDQIGLRLDTDMPANASS